MELSFDEKISNFDTELLALAAKYGIGNSEMKSLFTYTKYGDGVRYNIPDLPDNKFIKAATMLFDVYFRTGNLN